MKLISNRLIQIFYLILIIILGWSVIQSGYHYTFDIDELHIAHLIYLMTQGFKPYTGFFDVYSLFIYWFVMPVFLIFGFSFKTVSLARFLMIAVFAVRTFLSFLLVRKVFGKLAAWIFIPLFFLDPFVVFVSMQIRPENLMMVFFTGLLLLASATLEKPSKKNLFAAGLIFSLTFLISPKIIPSLIIFFVVIAYHYVKKRQFWNLLYFIDGVILTFVLYFLYFLVNGNLLAMFQLTFVDPFLLNNSIRNVTTLNYFYFSNSVIFGNGGKPMSWIYAWMLVPAAFAGGFMTFVDSVRAKLSKKMDLMKVMIFLCFAAQWVFMLFINSVFIQYYIPLSWYYSLFASVLIVTIFKMDISPSIKYILAGAAFIFLMLLFKSSVKGNFARTKMFGNGYIVQTQSIWKKVPENEPTFPNILFRKPVYPIVYGSVFSQFVANRYGPVFKAIESNKLKYLYQLNDDVFSYLDLPTQDYIRAHFRRDEKEPDMWVRIK